MKKVISVLVAVLLLLSLCACDLLSDAIDSVENEEAKPKTFTYEGISIELTTDFLRMDFISEEYDFIVGDDLLAVMGMKVTFDDTDISNYTVKEFAENFHQVFEENNPTELTDIDGIPVFQYRVIDDEDDQTMAVTFHKAEDCFWLVMFGADTAEFSKVYPDICKYAKTVKCE